MQVSPSGALIPYLAIQPGTRIKSTYFIRRTPVQITIKNYRDELIVGDMAPKPVEELAVLVEEVRSYEILCLIVGLNYYPDSNRSTFRYYQTRVITSDGQP